MVKLCQTNKYGSRCKSGYRQLVNNSTGNEHKIKYSIIALTIHCEIMCTGLKNSNFGYDANNTGPKNSNFE
jgi:hypothetical protein